MKLFFERVRYVQGITAIESRLLFMPPDLNKSQPYGVKCNNYSAFVTSLQKYDMALQILFLYCFHLQVENPSSHCTDGVLYGTGDYVRLKRENGLLYYEGLHAHSF